MSVFGEILIQFRGKNDGIPLHFYAGTYFIECWGAQGGNISTFQGGKGSYTSGTLTLNEQTTLFFFLGEAGSPNGTQTINGGGRGTQSSESSGGSGGGATDVRLINGNWSDFISLKSRIMVAAGGSGATNYAAGANGSHGGGLLGYVGTYCAKSGYTSNGLSMAQGGRTNLPGIGGISIESEPCNGTNGGFGFGGHNQRYYYGSGGGSGYYGGGGAGYKAGCVGTGASGSSYISGHDGCDSILESSEFGSILHSGNKIHYSNKFFSNTTMLEYFNLFPSPFGGFENGHVGNGVVRVTTLIQSAILCSKNEPSNMISIFTLIISFIPILQNY